MRDFCVLRKFVLKVNQDFKLLFDADTASKLLERWDTTFKQKIISEAMSLTSTPAVCSLLRSAKNETDSQDCSSKKFKLFKCRTVCVLVSSVVTIRNMPSVVLLCAMHGFAASVKHMSSWNVSMWALSKMHAQVLTFKLDKVWMYFLMY